jgi:XTP/dITP diphosphohydrolase
MSGTTHPKKLVIATSNQGKIEEIRKLLEGHPVILLRPEDVLGERIEVVEDGTTFQRNAEIKAREVAQVTGLLTLADDSGLQVDALGGLPGVRSARFAGERATDADNNAELLRRLADVEDGALGARFRCAMVLFDPANQQLRLSEGTCEGHISRVARGTEGFGYDPLFVVAAYGNRTMAELTLSEKNQVSHRGQAMRSMLPWILEAIAPAP